MNTISPILSMDSSCDQALQLVRKQLSAVGLRPVQTFDLQTSRLGLHDCPCPNHGTEECDCQLIVLLVYGEVMEPATLILHGNDGQTWISITKNIADRVDEKLLAKIRQALESPPRAGG